MPVSAMINTNHRLQGPVVYNIRPSGLKRKNRLHQRL